MRVRVAIRASPATPLRDLPRGQAPCSSLHTGGRRVGGVGGTVRVSTRIRVRIRVGVRVRVRVRYHGEVG